MKTYADVCEMACFSARENLVVHLVDGFLPENMHVHCIRLTAKQIVYYANIDR